MVPSPGRRLRPWTWGLCAVAAILLLSVAPAAQQASRSTPDLRSYADPALQAALVRTTGQLGLAPAIARRHLALALVDLTDADAPRLAMLNGDHMMYAASLPKIAILLGAFVQADRGRLTLDGPTLASLNRMIRNSSNADASAMLARVGEDALIEILTSPRYRFYDPTTGGGIWVGKAYGKAPAYRRDPLHGLSHGATAYQAARFYYLLDRGELLPPDLTRKMKDALSDPAIHHKFVKGLESVLGIRLYRKSGTWRQFHSDSALVEGRRKHFILVGIAEDPKGGEWLERLAVPLSDLVGQQSDPGPVAATPR